MALLEILIVIFLIATGCSVVFGSKCCRTGFNKYEWCSHYCCDNNVRLYSYCCNSYANSVNYYFSSECYNFWEENVWAPILIALFCLAILIGIIVCCVCCIKGCTASSRRTGPTMVTYPRQTGGVLLQNGVFIVRSDTGQQQHNNYQAPTQSGQGVYPPIYAGLSSNTYTGPPPPPPSFVGNTSEKTSIPV